MGLARYANAETNLLTRLSCIRGVFFMKKTSIFGIIVGLLALVGIVVTLCLYMKELRRLWTTFWDKLQAKRANLQIYMD